jgi:hypothetical protein
MKRIWRHKWIVIPCAAVIVLAAGAVGAVAVAGPGDSGSSAEMASLVTGSTVQAAGDLGATQAVQELGRLRGKLHERLERIKKRWAEARAMMSPADQAAFDQFQEKATGQREALREARKDLAETLKQMRDLVQKYHPATTTTSAP